MSDTTYCSNSTVSSQPARLEALQTLISYMQFDAQARRIPVATAEYVVWITAPSQLRYADNQAQAYDGYRWLPIDNETMQVWAERENVTLPEEDTAMTNEPTENNPLHIGRYATMTQADLWQAKKDLIPLKAAGEITDDEFMLRMRLISRYSRLIVMQREMDAVHAEIDDILSAAALTTPPVAAPAPTPRVKLTAREQKLVTELVTVHGVRSSNAIYVSDSMSGNSWTCRVEFSNRASGHLFSVTRPIDESKTDAAQTKFYDKVKAFKAALDAALAQEA